MIGAPQKEKKKKNPKKRHTLSVGQLIGAMPFVMMKLNCCHENGLGL